MILKNKVALVTGSAKRVGKNIALTLAKHGVHVIVHYRTSKSDALRAVKEIQSLGVRSQSYSADLSKVLDIQKLIKQIKKDFGQIDILINSASVYEKTYFDKISEQDWNIHLDTNLKSIFFLSQACSRMMLKQKSGKIVNIIDSDIHHPYNHYLPYMVSKAGLAGLTYCLAKELAPHIQVNGISPGPVLMQDHWGPKIIKEIIDVTPLKKIGSPQDISNAVLYCLEGTDFMTGAIIPIDGGQHIV